MAQRVVVTLFDDIDGSEAAETIAFGLDGKSYEIDLNQTNAETQEGSLRSGYNAALFLNSLLRSKSRAGFGSRFDGTGAVHACP